MGRVCAACCVLVWIAGGLCPGFAQPPAAPAQPPAAPAQPPAAGSAAVPADTEAPPLGGFLRDLTRQLRQELIGSPGQPAGLVDPEAWSGAGDPNRWVVVVHGFASGAEALREFHRRLDQPGLACRRFAYANDGSVQAAAEALSRALKDVAHQHPERKLTLVCHSMGSLVARLMLETGELDPKNVDQFIMISPPNHGSQLARFPIGFDPQKLAASIEQSDIRWIARSLLEGSLGAAQTDLRPGSPLIGKLTQFRRNPRVRYTIFAGTDAALDPAEADEITRTTQQWMRSGRLPAVIGDQILAATGSDEMVVGRGDGVVSLKSAKLAGVDDFVPLPFGHCVVTEQLDEPVGKQLIDAIVSRIVL